MAYLPSKFFLNVEINCHIIADKGFIDGKWHKDISQTIGNQIFTPKRANQL
ncbi:MAG: hypothetical protein V7K41_28060 [Nostoc sp.]